MKSDVLINQLHKQLGFLTRSCESFDAGFHDEAIRIAVSIRVLVHDTRSSSSLLAQLGAKSLLLRSSCPLINAKTLMFAGGLSSARVSIDNGRLKEATYVPNLDSLSRRATFLPVEDWWNQCVYRISEGDVTRRHIVLGAVNKDGGAHVDPNLTREYEALCKGIFSVGFATPQESIDTSLPNSHLTDLRQMGHELLNSPDLINIANSQ